MPLLKRFETELVPEWRKQCIDYKGLKRRAESLVGSEKAGELQEKEQEEFQQFFSHEMEKISHLYTKQERKLCKFFCAMEGKVDSLLNTIQANRKDFVLPDGTPNPGTIFADPANKQVPVAMLAFMVHIDALRSFALLNTLAVLHIAQRHCSKLLCHLVLHRLYQEPFYSCYRLTTLVEEISRISTKFLEGSIARTSAAQSETAGLARRSSEGDAVDYLSAYCTWVNQKGRVPPWVCKSLADTAVLQGDRRNLRVKALMQEFVASLSSKLQARGLASMVPDLVKQMSVSKPAAQKQQPQNSPSAARQTPQVPTVPRSMASRPVNIPGRSESAAHPQYSPAGPHPARVDGDDRRQRPSGAIPAPAQAQAPAAHKTFTFASCHEQHAKQEGQASSAPSKTFVHTQQRPAEASKKQAAAGGALRLTRSCWDLQALTLSSPSVREGLHMLYPDTASSGHSSNIPSPTSSRSSSPPMGASPPGSGVAVPGMQSGAGRRSRDNLKMTTMLEDRALQQSELIRDAGRNESVMASAAPMPLTKQPLEDLRGCREPLLLPRFAARVDCDV